MSSLGRVYHLLKKDFVLEFRSFYALGGVLLYVISTLFIVYQAFNTLDERLWNSMFWVIFLFTAINAILRSFVNTSDGKKLFHYSFIHPLEYLLSKVIFNLLTLFLVAIITFLTMSLFFDNPVKEMGLFLLAVGLASLGISICFSFSAAISSKSSSSATMMSILSLPVILPILLLVIKISAQSMRLITDSSISTDFGLLLAINMIMIGVTTLLFPYLWKS